MGNQGFIGGGKGARAFGVFVEDDGSGSLLAGAGRELFGMAEPLAMAIKSATVTNLNPLARTASNTIGMASIVGALMSCERIVEPGRVPEMIRWATTMTPGSFQSFGSTSLLF